MSDLPDLIFDLIDHGISVGVISGVWDIYHAGYGLYFRACKKCLGPKSVLVGGVDENRLVAINRENNNRPYNDSPVRLATLNETSEIDLLWLVDHPIIFTAISRGYHYCLLSIQSHLKTETLPSFCPENAWLWRQTLEKKQPDKFAQIARSLYFFWTEGDPNFIYKHAQAVASGGRLIQIQKFTDLSSTAIGNHFGVQQRPDQKNRFGISSYWRRSQDQFIAGDFPPTHSDPQLEDLWPQQA
ncbi:hypothetical protein ACFLZP_01680 [Patescibacteria group bacterium]